MSRSHVFLEHLTARVFVLKILPLMLQEQFQIKSCLKYVYYVDGTKTATWLIWLIKPLKWIMGIEVEKMQFRLIDVRDESGLLLRLRVPYQDIFVVQNEYY